MTRIFALIIIVKKTNEEKYHKKINFADTIEEEQTNVMSQNLF